MASSIYHKLEPGKAKALFKKIDHAAIYFFMGGCYMLGVVFYLADRIPYNHGICHICVLLGAGSNYAAIYATH